MDVSPLLPLSQVCLEEIFAFLGVRDLVKCRAVCRRFKACAEATRVNELVVNWTFPRNWYRTDRPIDDSNSISLNAFSFVQSSKLNLNHLKFLFINVDHSANAAFDIGIVNVFKELLHFEVEFEALSDVPFFILTNPNIDVLACNRIDRVQVEHVETIRRLKCDYKADKHLAKFKSLEFLELQCIGAGLSELSLLDWPFLKELSVADSDLSDEFKRSLATLMRQRTDLRREELKIYLNNVLLDDERQLEFRRGSNPSAMRDSERFWIKNYKKIRPNVHPPVTSVHYNELMEIEFELFNDFFDRFREIAMVTASEPVDCRDFELFLDFAKQVVGLTLINTKLDQLFMNRLPSTNGRLTYLCIKGVTDIVSDFDFILRFDRLRTFITDSELSTFEVVGNAFRLLNEFATFRFTVDDDTVQIDRSKSYKLQIFKGDIPTPETTQFEKGGMDWDEMLAIRRFATILKVMAIKRAKSD